MTRGIITGCDRNQEIFLPWWWWHTRCHTDLPVLFVDFGMSEAGRNFCQERGELVTLPPPDFVVMREAVPQERAEEWERLFISGERFWQMRRTWFLKPFALLASSFKQGLWLDVDCALCEPLEPLFELLQEDVALAPDRGSLFSDVLYNAGVILFQHGSTLISRWAERSVRENDRHLSDQTLLNTMVSEGETIQVLPDRYNWNMHHSGCDDIAIAHYMACGKEKIGAQMQLLEQLGCIKRLKA